LPLLDFAGAAIRGSNALLRLQPDLRQEHVDTTSSANFQFDPRGRASAQVVITVSGFPAITVEGETGYVH
jgi:hypothetical protein